MKNRKLLAATSIVIVVVLLALFSAWVSLRDAHYYAVAYEAANRNKDLSFTKHYRTFYANQTITYSPKSSDAELEQSIRSTFPEIRSDTLKSFLQANREKHRVYAVPFLPIKYEIIPYQEAEWLMKSANDSEMRNYFLPMLKGEETYGSVVRFTAAGVSKDGRQVIIYAEHRSGSLMGGGMLVLLNKIGNEWQVANSDGWIS